MVSRNNNDNSETNLIMMPDNKLHEGEFIVKIMFLCLKLYTNESKIEGSVNYEYWVPHPKTFFDKVP